MKTLFLLRHAKSSKDDPTLKDYDRPLNDRGRKQAPWVGQLIKKEHLIPDLIISSGALRTRQTAEVVAQESGYSEKIVYTDDLYEASIKKYLKVINHIDEKFNSIMIVGHNPEQEDFLSHLTHKTESMSTSALAQLRLPIKKWKDLTDNTPGQLIHLWRPEE